MRFEKFYIAMKTTKPPLAHAGCHYIPLLERYARRLIKNEWEAIRLVNDVLKDQFEINRLVPSDHLRHTLKFDVRLRCFYFNQSRIFDRPPIGFPLDQKLINRNFILASTIKTGISKIKRRKNFYANGRSGKKYFLKEIS